MRKHIHLSGFTAPAGRALGSERRTAAFAELIATTALMLGTVVAAIVVTAGIARADVGSDVIGNEGAVFAIALLLGLVFIGLGGLTIVPRNRRHRH
jgi:hypothetical protein